MLVGTGGETVCSFSIDLSVGKTFVTNLSAIAKDDRWLDWLDSKVALLIDRNGVDPRAYGGKSYDEYVSHSDFPPRSGSNQSISFEQSSEQSR